MEGVGQRVVTDLPAFGQPGNDLAGLRVLVGQGFGDIAQQHPVFQPIDLERVDTDQGGVVAKERDVQSLAGLGVIPGRASGEAQRQGAGGQQTAHQVGGIQWGALMWRFGCMQGVDQKSYASLVYQ